METNNLTIAEFQPAEAQLTELALKAKSVDITNIKLVHDTRIELRDTRIALTKKGKELREGAMVFQKAVIAKEKDLLAIITPEEDRLDAIEEADKKLKEMETRRSELPTRHAALASIGDNIPTPDDMLLAMDDNGFNEYRIHRIEGKLAADKKAMEDKQREDDRIAREKLEAEKAEFEKQKKAENDKRAAEQKIEDDKRAAERLEIEKEKARLAGIEEQRQKEEAAKKAEIEQAERKAKAEADRKAAMEAEQAYKDWLKSIGYNEETDMIDMVGSTVTVYRKLGTYKPNK